MSDTATLKATYERLQAMLDEALSDRNGMQYEYDQLRERTEWLQQRCKALETGMAQARSMYEGEHKKLETARARIAELEKSRDEYRDICFRQHKATAEGKDATASLDAERAKVEELRRVLKAIYVPDHDLHEPGDTEADCQTCIIGAALAKAGGA
jgi:chromosome segregation ATPase